MTSLYNLNSRSDIEIKGLIVQVTPKAILFHSDETGQESWIPKSLISEWEALGDSKSYIHELPDFCKEDEAEFTIPKWLARRELLIDEE